MFFLAGAFVVAVCELSGQILCYDEKHYRSLGGEEGEAELAEAMSRACAQVKRKMDPKVKKMFAGPSGK